MEWDKLFSWDTQPDIKQITAYVDNPLWSNLCKCLEETYGVVPKIEYSRCSAKPGWNVKYKKSSRALCTLYPESGYFTCMVSIGMKEALEAEGLLVTCTAYVKELYAAANSMNGSRWLMIEVTDERILADVKELIKTRVKTKKKASGI